MRFEPIREPSCSAGSRVNLLCHKARYCAGTIERSFGKSKSKHARSKKMRSAARIPPKAAG